MTSVEQSGKFPRVDAESSSTSGVRKLARNGQDKADQVEEHFGVRLRRAREDRGLTLGFVAERTKISRSTLALLETGKLGDLPAAVYVRGFIRSYARAIGLADSEPLMLFERAIEARDAAEEVKASIPVPAEENHAGPSEVDDGAGARRGVGFAVFVIILLLIATITLSFFLRRPPSSGEGLSLRDGRSEQGARPSREGHGESPATEIFRPSPLV